MGNRYCVTGNFPPADALLLQLMSQLAGVFPDGVQRLSVAWQMRHGWHELDRGFKVINELLAPSALGVEQ